MTVSDVLSSKAMVGLETIIDSIAPGLQAKDVPVGSAVKQILEANFSARRETTGGRASPRVWQARAAMEVLQPSWHDETLRGASELGVAEFVSDLLAKLEGLWSELASSAAGDSVALDGALEFLARVSSSGVHQRGSTQDAAVQAAITLLSGLRLELGP